MFPQKYGKTRVFRQNIANRTYKADRHCSNSRPSIQTEKPKTWTPLEKVIGVNVGGSMLKKDKRSKLYCRWQWIPNTDNPVDEKISTSTAGTV